MSADSAIGVASVLATLLTVAATIVAALIAKGWDWRRRRFPEITAPLSTGAVSEHTSFSIPDLVKVVDLRGSPAPAGKLPGKTVLTDSYLVTRESEEGNGLVCIYCTSGQLEGRCASHPNDSEWIDWSGGDMKRNYALAVCLNGLAKGSSVRVTNVVTYTGAFDTFDREHFETHVERPTRSLTFVLLFSPEHPCVSADGYQQTEGRKKSELVRHNRPQLLRGGTLLYWRIYPQEGEWLPVSTKFSLDWRWRPAATAVDVMGTVGQAPGTS